jgi:polyketide-type polyunsaturated fatty acid synthase PfaA
MDMEADLGIDSIKRVEILGAVQDQITDLPELNPEELAELRTLGEIVAYMHQSSDGEQGIADNDQIESLTTEKTPTTQDADTKMNDAATVDTSAHVPSAVVTLQRLPRVNKIANNLGELNTKNTQKTAVLLVDDGTNTAVLLSHKLLANDCTVTVLQPNWQPCNKAADFTTEVKLITLGSEEQTFDEIELETLLTDHCPLDMVIYLQANQTAAGINFSNTAKQGVMLAFLLAKHSKLTSANNERSAFVVVTRQGGTLGYIQPSMTINGPLTAQPDLVQGGLAGLVKTLAHECRASVSANQVSHQSGIKESAQVFCRLLDFSSNLDAENTVGLILDELLDSNTALSEVGYDTDNRCNHLNSDSNHRLTLVAKPTNSFTLTQKQQAEGVNAHSVFVVSGGAKGVTAHCVIELAKQYQATFILLGRSPLLINKEANHSIHAEENKADKNQQLNSQGAEPSWADGLDDEATLKKAAMQVLIASGEKPTPVKVNEFVSPIIANREIVATLDAIKQAGGKAQYVACDVCDSDKIEQGVTLALDSLAKQTQTRLSITGIIHGAGVLADKHITQKTTAEFNKVYDTKIQGLSALLSICPASQLKHLVLFSSAAGFYGNAGQADYAVANEILNKTAYRFKTLYPGTQVLSFNWGPWDGGMVTPALKRMFNERGTYIIPLDAGAKLLASELNANNNRCPQILVGNDLSAPSEKASHAVKTITDDETEAIASGNEVTEGIENSKGSEGSEDREKVIQGADVKKLVVSRLSARVVKTLQATNNAFLADHSIAEQQVLPTVCAHNWMREAVRNTYPEFVVQGITDYKLFKGITFDNTDINDNNNNNERDINSAVSSSKPVDNQYLIDMKVDVNLDLAESRFAPFPPLDKALGKSSINVIDDNTVLLVNTQISSVNESGNTVFHYQANVCLSLAEELSTPQKLTTPFTAQLSSQSSSQLTQALTKPLTSEMAEAAADLYQNGTLFHGQSLQGISHLVACNEQGLVLACQVPKLATKKQGDFSMSTDNIFANDLVYQAMLVWTQKVLGLGSLPSTTRSWQTFANVQPEQLFYISLAVLQAPVNTVKLQNAKVTADISLLDQQGQCLALVKGVEVTASDNLQGLFLATSIAHSQQQNMLTTED